MPIADLQAYKDLLEHPHQQLDISIPTMSAITGKPTDLWVYVPPVGVAPTTAVAPTSTTPGSRGQRNPASGSLGIIGAQWSTYFPGVYIICDRLSHQGGLVANLTTPQTTNLPTAALTRYTDGIGVFLALTVYTILGTTGTTVTVSYTNTDNVAARISPAVTFGATNSREVGRSIQIPLVSGDIGVKSVESVTVLATTGSVGSFGVTLFKPLYAVIVDEAMGVTVNDLITGKTFGGLPTIANDACLFVLSMNGNNTPVSAGSLLLAEW